MSPNNRSAARLVVLDAQGRLLLFQYARANGERFWATPGGGLESGESFERAAAREAREEVGVVVSNLTPLWESTVDFIAAGQHIHQHERFFLVRMLATAVREDVSLAHQREGILQSRWWPVTDLERTAETVFPLDLSQRLKAALDLAYPHVSG